MANSPFSFMPPPDLGSQIPNHETYMGAPQGNPAASAMMDQMGDAMGGGMPSIGGPDPSVIQQLMQQRNDQLPQSPFMPTDPMRDRMPLEQRLQQHGQPPLPPTGMFGR